MKGLALYTAIAPTGFLIYSVYYAVAGDNTPFWTIIAVACLPVIVFATIYLKRGHK